MAPTVTFSPANGATGVPISNNITIIFSEAVRNIDNTVLTDSNSGDANGVGSLITLRLNNTYGTNIAFYATIDTNKTVITIDPTNNLPHSQAVYVVIGATVEDSAGNPITAANATFTTVQETTGPTVSSVYPADNQNGVSISDNISVTFSEAMEPSYITTTTSDTNCAGTIRVSSDNFSNCVRMSSEPVSSNSNRTWTLDPVDNLAVGTTYKIIVTTGVQDTVGNPMSSQYDNSSGFTIAHYALDFDGTDDNVSANGVTTELDLSDNLPLSVSAWVYPDNGTKEQLIFGFYQNNPFNQGPGVWFGSTVRKFSYYDNDGGSSAVLEYSSNTYSINNWHHVVFTIGDDQAGVLYVNGSSAGTFSGAFDSGGLDMFSIGVEYDNVSGSAGNPEQYFDGKIDEVAVWNDELTSAEVTAIYNSGYTLDVSSNSGLYVSAANLQGYYRFNEGSGTSLQDNSSNSNTGTITGAIWTTGLVSE